MKWLPIALRCDLLHLSICTLLYMSFSLNTGVTCASSHLICHNIFPFSACDVLQAECSLPSVKSGKAEKANKGKRGRDVKLHYGYYAGEVYLPAAGRAAHAPVGPNEPAWRDLRGNKRLHLSPMPDPSTHPLTAPQPWAWQTKSRAPVPSWWRD